MKMSLLFRKADPNIALRTHNGSWKAVIFIVATRTK